MVSWESFYQEQTMHHHHITPNVTISKNLVIVKKGENPIRATVMAILEIHWDLNYRYPDPCIFVDGHHYTEAFKRIQKVVIVNGSERPSYDFQDCYEQVIHGFEEGWRQAGLGLPFEPYDLIGDVGFSREEFLSLLFKDAAALGASRRLEQEARLAKRAG
ncbi:MAG: hypothetical protein QXL94_02745 [Candidatus Parvarchaeum sp.]